MLGSSKDAFGSLQSQAAGLHPHSLDPASSKVSGKASGTRLGLRLAGWKEGRKQLRKVTG